MYQFVREAKKRDFAGFQHHNRVFRAVPHRAFDDVDVPFPIDGDLVDADALGHALFLEHPVGA